MVRYLPFLISLVLSIYALFSCIQTRDEDVPHLPKLVWILLIVLVPFVGPITWLLMSRAQAGRQLPRGRASYGPATRTTAPDDDPEFLAWLERNRQRRGPAEPPAKPGPAGEKDDPAAANDAGEPDRPDPDDGESGDRAR